MTIQDIQDRFSKEDLTYKITKDIDLNGITLNIPNNCTLDFQGGTFTNGTINLNNTKVLPNGCIITDYITATITGNYNIGQCLFDTSLGKPKWWNGTIWIDATGTEV